MSAADEVERLRQEAHCTRVCGKESACAGSSTCQANRAYRKTAALPARVAKMEAFEQTVRDDFAGVVCTCHEAYSGRGLKDPSCMYHEFEATVAALAALDAVTA